jgi:hypothetical protein
LADYTAPRGQTKRIDRIFARLIRPTFIRLTGWQYNPSIYVERLFTFCDTNAFTQHINVFYEQVVFPFQQIDRKKIGSTRYTITTVIGHLSSLMPYGGWRDAYPPYLGLLFLLRP